MGKFNGKKSAGIRRFVANKKVKIPEAATPAIAEAFPAPVINEPASVHLEKLLPPFADIQNAERASSELVPPEKKKRDKKKKQKAPPEHKIKLSRSTKKYFKDKKKETESHEPEGTKAKPKAFLSTKKATKLKRPKPDVQETPEAIVQGTNFLPVPVPSCDARTGFRIGAFFTTVRNATKKIALLAKSVDYKALSGNLKDAGYGFAVGAGARIGLQFALSSFMITSPLTQIVCTAVIGMVAGAATGITREVLARRKGAGKTSLVKAAVDGGLFGSMRAVSGAFSSFLGVAREVGGILMSKDRREKLNDKATRKRLIISAVFGVIGAGTAHYFGETFKKPEGDLAPAPNGTSADLSKMPTSLMPWLSIFGTRPDETVAAEFAGPRAGIMDQDATVPNAPPPNGASADLSKMPTSLMPWLSFFGIRPEETVTTEFAGPRAGIMDQDATVPKAPLEPETQDPDKPAEPATPREEQEPRHKSPSERARKPADLAGKTQEPTVLADRPVLPVPKALKELLGPKTFNLLPEDLKKDGAAFARMGTAGQMRYLKDASFYLFRQGGQQNDNYAAGLLEKGLKLAENESRLETPTGRQICADMAYLLANGKGGYPRDLQKALAYAMLAGEENPYTRQLTKLVSRTDPGLLARVTEKASLIRQAARMNLG